VQVLRARGCRVLAVARTTKRLDLALALGAEAVALSGADDDTGAARAFSGREGVDLVVETAGTAVAVERAVSLCRPGGRVVLTGLPHEATALNFFWVVRRELRIIGSMIYQDEFPEAMRLLATGGVRVDRLLSQTFPLDRIDEAFEAHRSPDSIKVAVIP
ncbi:MAG: zinc-binding dehydrogenase, partial [Candidatus Rokuibacteriota bacterium]